MFETVKLYFTEYRLQRSFTSKAVRKQIKAVMRTLPNNDYDHEEKRKEKKTEGVNGGKLVPFFFKA